MSKRAADIIVHDLEELIFNGQFPHGSRLDEVKLAKRFGVSRTPLREALQKLSLSGLIELIPNRGAFVRQPKTVELIEMFEVMAEMEAICGRLAARRISDSALQALTDTNNKCQIAVNTADIDAYYVGNEQFHKIIYQQSKNAFLEQETLKLYKRLKPFRRQQLRLRGRLEQSMAEHNAILQALKNGDAETTASLLRSHVAVQSEKFHNFIASLKIDPNFRKVNKTS